MQAVPNVELDACVFSNPADPGAPLASRLAAARLASLQLINDQLKQVDCRPLRHRETTAHLALLITFKQLTTVVAFGSSMAGKERKSAHRLEPG